MRDPQRGDQVRVRRVGALSSQERPGKLRLRRQSRLDLASRARARVDDARAKRAQSFRVVETAIEEQTRVFFKRAFVRVFSTDIERGASVLLVLFLSQHAALLQALARERLAVLVLRAQQTTAHERRRQGLAEPRGALEGDASPEARGAAHARVRLDGVGEDRAAVPDPLAVALPPGRALHRGRRELGERLAEPALLAVAVDLHQFEGHARLRENQAQTHAVHAVRHQGTLRGLAVDVVAQTPGPARREHGDAGRAGRRQTFRTGVRALGGAARRRAEHENARALRVHARAFLRVRLRTRRRNLGRRLGETRVLRRRRSRLRLRWRSGGRRSDGGRRRRRRRRLPGAVVGNLRTHRARSFLRRGRRARRRVPAHPRRPARRFRGRQSASRHRRRDERDRPLPRHERRFASGDGCVFLIVDGRRREGRAFGSRAFHVRHRARDGALFVVAVALRLPHGIQVLTIARIVVVARVVIHIVVAPVHVVVEGVPVDHRPPARVHADHVLEPRRAHQRVVRVRGVRAQLRAVHGVERRERDVQKPLELLVRGVRGGVGVVVRRLFFFLLRPRLALRAGARAEHGAVREPARLEDGEQRRARLHRTRDGVHAGDGRGLHHLHHLLLHEALALGGDVPREQRAAYGRVVQRVASQVPDAHQQRGHAVSFGHHALGGPHQVLLRALELRHHRREHEHVHHHARQSGDVRNEVPGVRRREHVRRRARDDVRAREPQRQRGSAGVALVALVQIVVQRQRQGDDEADKDGRRVRAERERRREPPRFLEHQEIQVPAGEDDVPAALRRHSLLRALPGAAQQTPSRLRARLRAEPLHHVRDGDVPSRGLVVLNHARPRALPRALPRTRRRGRRTARDPEAGAGRLEQTALGLVRAKHLSLIRGRHRRATPQAGARHADADQSTMRLKNVCFV
mmetsp:Transcript_13201/g.56219  ORF Transcript_13201/g.56219 Transcript_13201/m.56219 type:complete len:918 (+) Transcript_13201:339-3092(+)